MRLDLCEVLGSVGEVAHLEFGVVHVAHGRLVPGVQRQHLRRGGLVFEAHRLLYHSTLGVRVMKEREGATPAPAHREVPVFHCWRRNQRQQIERVLY